MADVLSCAPYSGVNTNYKRGTILHAVVSFAAGAPAIVAARSAPGITIADGATGAYTGTFPKCPRAVAWTQCMVPSAATPDSNMVTFSAFSPTAGTFTLQAHANAAPADLPDTAELWLFFMCEGG
jgi:hypothetical protein